MIRHLVSVVDPAANAAALDEYLPYNIGARCTDLRRKRATCGRCDGEGQFNIWRDADTLVASWPCSRCRGACFVHFGRWRRYTVRSMGAPERMMEDE